jgi:hypothetical protein
VLIAATTVVVVLLALFLVWRRTQQTTTTPVPAPVSSVEVAPSAPVTPAPEPLLPAIRLSSDTGAGKISFDDQPPADLQDAQWSLDKIAPGDHTLKFEGRQGNASFTFSVADSTLPAVKVPIAAKGVLALVVSSASGRMHVYSSDSTARLSLDGQPAINIPAEGSEFSSLATGAHQLTVTRAIGGDKYQLEVEVSPSPVLTTFFESGRDVGTLLILTGQDKAKVFLNDKPVSQLTSTYGQLRISNLDPKDYVVRVSKSGFQDAPEQKIHIRKDEQSKLLFDLQPTPHLASLSIQGGTPGATVLIDQAPVGTIQPNGSLVIASVNPGERTVEIRKERFKFKQSKKHFVAGSAVALVAADAALEAAPPELRLNFAADAQVTLGKAGETPAKITSGNPLTLTAGAYALTMRNADGFVRTSTIDLAVGQSRTIDLPAPDGMSKWDNPLGWSQEKGVYIRRGGDFVLYGVSPAAGTFVFSAQLQKGHRLQWVVHYSNANNYDLFQMDDNNFYRTSYRNGQKTSDEKVPQKGDKKTFHTIQIRVEANQIVHQIKQGDNWVVLDRWAEPGADLSVGKFGFYLPGNDQVALSSFVHYADLNIH